MANLKSYDHCVQHINFGAREMIAGIWELVREGLLYLACNDKNAFFYV